MSPCARSWLCGMMHAALPVYPAPRAYRSFCASLHARFAAFSATCWFSAKAIIDARVAAGNSSDKYLPLGLVASTWGGTAIKAWNSASVNEQCMRLYPFNTTTPGDCGLLRAPCNSSVLYNALIYPFMVGPMKVRSFIWFQGENDAAVSEYSFYSCELNGMINDWRASFNSLAAQWTTIALGPYLAGANSVLADFRDMQCKTTWALQNTSCAILADDGDPLSPIGSVHSRNKQLVGRRVAAGILSALYGIDSDFSTQVGPLYQSASATTIGNTLYANITFQPNTLGSSGLQYVPPHVNHWQNSSRCPTELPDVTDLQCGWYTILASDGHAYNATAISIGNGLQLQLSATVPSSGLSVIGTQFGWANWPVVNWYNGEGQPMVPWSVNITA